MICTCGEVELGVANDQGQTSTAELGGVLHRSPEDGRCTRHEPPFRISESTIAEVARRSAEADERHWAAEGTAETVTIDDEYSLLIDPIKPVVLVRRHGVTVIDPAGHPINFWLPEAALEHIGYMRATR